MRTIPQLVLFGLTGAMTTLVTGAVHRAAGAIAISPFLVVAFAVVAVYLYKDARPHLKLGRFPWPGMLSYVLAVVLTKLALFLRWYFVVAYEDPAGYQADLGFAISVLESAYVLLLGGTTIGLAWLVSRRSR